MRQTLAREVSNLIERGRDRQLRLAVTGLSRAGKTAFLTSLVHQLRHAGLEARLDLLPAAREGRLLGAQRIAQADLGIPRFPYDQALAALDAGLIDFNETVYCPGFKEISGRRFHCWKRGGHGNVDLHTSLRDSCDVYYYELALRAGIERISAMAERLGFGVQFDLPMTSVAQGLAPSREWKLANRGQPWVVGDSVNAAIGQGFVLASPLQLAVMTARLATSRAVMPRLIKTIDGVEQPSSRGEPLGLNDNLTIPFFASLAMQWGFARIQSCASEPPLHWILNGDMWTQLQRLPLA